MERRTSLCWAMGDNPLVSVHDVGAGGLSNAMHELVHEWDLGLLNPTRELIQASHSTSHHHHARLRMLSPIVVFNNGVPFRGYHVVPYNVITPKCWAMGDNIL